MSPAPTPTRWWNRIRHLPLLRRWPPRDEPMPSPGQDQAARNKSLGRAGERLAEQFMRRQGFRSVARNTRLPKGEMDLIMESADGRTIAFIEVKTRQAESHYPGETAITPAKKRRLLRLAQKISRTNRWQDRRLRIDVIAIDWPDDEAAKKGAEPAIRHHTNAITLNG